MNAKSSRVEFWIGLWLVEENNALFSEHADWLILTGPLEDWRVLVACRSCALGARLWVVKKANGQPVACDLNSRFRWLLKFKRNTGQPTKKRGRFVLPSRPPPITFLSCEISRVFLKFVSFRSTFLLSSNRFVYHRLWLYLLVFVDIPLDSLVLLSCLPCCIHCNGYTKPLSDL